MHEPLPYEPECAPIDAPYELRGTRPDTLAAWDRHVIVDVIHDGYRIPPSLTPFFDDDGELRQDVRDAFMRERDWGAAALADRLAYHLGLRGYYSIQAARVVCDYNRFRGRSVREAGHVGRHALFPPASELLTPEEGEAALKACFDPVSKAVFDRAHECFNGEPIATSRLLRITAHTYDDRVGEGHRRPKASLIFTPFEYHEASRLPSGAYPPVFHDRLAEFTADRALAYRIALMLEKNYLPVAVNSPYFLPLGGAEMRLQVWCYMQHLRQAVERLGTPDDVSRFEPLWPVLSHVDEPWSTREISADVHKLLDELERFVESHRYEAVERYRYSAYRPNAIEVELRKDRIWEGSWQTMADGHQAFVPEPGGMNLEEIDRAASVLAQGVRKYLVEDQPEKRAGAHVQ
ncbi:MAG: hypothetical protein QNJ98_03850 [Planctomycetota bacterium]|nr:hypothetical protein [Planctomycetota bacterium]